MITQTVGNLILDLERSSHTGGTTQSRDIFGVIKEGMRTTLSKIKPKETARRALIENALYDQVNKYQAPDDLDRKYIMQWYKLDQRYNVNTLAYPMEQVTNSRFDSYVWNRANKNMFTIEYDSAIKYVKVSDFGPKIGTTIQEMSSLTSNGTWNTGGNIVNLTEDPLNFITGNGSLRFDINTSSNTGFIENLSINTVDLNEFIKKGSVFGWISLPDYNIIQTVSLRLYSSLSDYYEITVNRPHNVATWQTSWQLMKFFLDPDFYNTVGTPNPNIMGIRITITSNATSLIKAVRLDNLVARKGAAYGVQYLSDWIFQDAVTNLRQPNPIQNSDIIVLEYDSYQCLLKECSIILAREIFGPDDAQPDILALTKERDEAYKTYRNNNKDEFIPETQTSYYFGDDYDAGNWGSHNGGN